MNIGSNWTIWIRIIMKAKELTRLPETFNCLIDIQETNIFKIFDNFCSSSSTRDGNQVCFFQLGQSFRIITGLTPTLLARKSLVTLLSFPFRAIITNICVAMVNRFEICMQSSFIINKAHSSLIFIISPRVVMSRVTTKPVVQFNIMSLTLGDFVQQVLIMGMVNSID